MRWMIPTNEHIELRANHRRPRCELLVLRRGWQLAADRCLAHNARQQIQTHRRKCALPKLACGFSLADKAPILRSDRSRVHLFRKMVDRAAVDRLAFLDRPFHCGDSAMAR